MTEAALAEEMERHIANGLSPLAAGILSALDLGIAKDARSFARIFGVAHALVIRESGILADRGLLSRADDHRGTFSARE
ncbi:hypothetical protein QCN27_14550 [Cereibacter sp. SYSU M97828]|nr:hypothetical protein [Cereibacter flavus]